MPRFRSRGLYSGRRLRGTKRYWCPNRARCENSSRVPSPARDVSSYREMDAQFNADRKRTREDGMVDDSMDCEGGLEAASAASGSSLSKKPRPGDGDGPSTSLPQPPRPAAAAAQKYQVDEEERLRIEHAICKQSWHALASKLRSLFDSEQGRAILSEWFPWPVHQLPPEIDRCRCGKLYDAGYHIDKTIYSEKKSYTLSSARPMQATVCPDCEGFWSGKVPKRGARETMKAYKEDSDDYGFDSDISE